MPLLTIKPENQQRLAVLVPIIALILSLFVVYPAQGRYRDLQKTIQTERKELETLRATPIPTVGPVAPTAEESPSEPPAFLGQIRMLAAETGCRVSGFDVSAAGSKDTAPLRVVRARVELEGQFYQIRNFLTQLGRAPRLYVVTDFSLTGKTPVGPQSANSSPSNLLHASIEIERYVASATATR
ncbi:MAG: Pilus assembly protein PilO [Chthonomonadaceae bacterium]|nr:Pilus assembly protein PilO [Chthonomonadaceae bacterium]